MKTASPISVKEFGEIVKAEIESSPYTAKEVLSGVGINPSYLGKWRQGVIKEPTFKQVIDIANFLGRPYEIFIFGEMPEPHVKIPLSKYQATLETIRDIVSEQIQQSEKQRV